MASISCQHIYKIYPGATAPSVTDFNLEIQDKEFIIFVGPSGCGKSTTLRMIAGLEEISKGEMYIGGRLINDVPPKDRDIAMVFQSYALYPHMTVYKNIAFGLELRKTPKDEIDKRVHEAAKILEIEHLLDRKPKALSGGFTVSDTWLVQRNGMHPRNSLMISLKDGQEAEHLPHFMHLRGFTPLMRLICSTVLTRPPP